MPAFPTQNIDLFYMKIYGGFGYNGCGDWGEAGYFGCQCAAYLGLATGIPQTGNPPYTVNNFLGMYPKFFGSPTIASGTLIQGQSTIAIDSTPGLNLGQLITCQGLNPGTVISEVNSDSSISVSSEAVASGIQQLMIYEAQIVPLAVIQAYLNLAFVSLMSSRWREAWPLAMALYIAHYATLYAETDGNPQATASQIVANSLQAGVEISKSADGVAQGLKPLEKLDNWAAWSLTQYGVQLATMARVVGAGAAYWRG